MSTISAGVTVPTALNLSGDTTGALTFQVSGTVTAATISSAGNFGIGTTSPIQRLTVESTSDVRATIRNSTENTSYASSLDFATGSGSLASTNVVARVQGLITQADPSALQSALAFHTNSGDSVSEKMRIDTSGNVGIGNTAPSYKLQVNNASASSTADAITVQNSGVSSTGHIAGIRFRYISAEPAAIRAILTNTINGAGALGFFTSSDGSGANLTERMRISAGGYVAIGRATTDTVRLFVQGSTTGSSDFALNLYNSAEAQLMYVRNDGLITTGAAASSPYNNTTGSAANMYVDSSGILYRSTSSLRYKSDVTDATHGLADVLKLRSVTYKGINDGDKVFGGLIAEEVHDAGLTEFVAYDNEGRPDALHYGNMVALLVKAVQEQQEQIKTLQDRIAELETK